MKFIKRWIYYQNSWRLIQADTSKKPNLSAPPQTISSAIGRSRSLPNVCDNPPAPHCCYRRHHGNCFHKGSRGMSCVSDFLASLPSSGTLYSAAVWDGERRLSCAENADLHTSSGDRPDAYCSAWREKWSWVGKTRECVQVSHWLCWELDQILNSVK